MTGLKKLAEKFNRQMIWLIITEGWCGDAAQNLPVIEKIAGESINIVSSAFPTFHLLDRRCGSKYKREQV
ncbi:MAG: thioredoxin family protein [Pyrinomonadaceae bacterium]